MWLAANQPDFAVEDAEFVELVHRQGLIMEHDHVQSVGPVEALEYPAGDVVAGCEETRRLLESKDGLF